MSNFAQRATGLFKTSLHGPVKFREFYPSLSEFIQARSYGLHCRDKAERTDDVSVQRDTSLWRLAGLLAGQYVNIELIFFMLSDFVTMPAVEYKDSLYIKQMDVVII